MFVHDEGEISCKLKCLSKRAFHFMAQLCCKVVASFSLTLLMFLPVGVLEICLPVFVDGVMSKGKPLRYVVYCIYQKSNC